MREYGITYRGYLLGRFVSIQFHAKKKKNKKTYKNPRRQEKEGEKYLRARPFSRFPGLQSEVRAASSEFFPDELQVLERY